MKAENETTGHNRTLRITGLNDGVELLVTVNYVSKPNEPGVLVKASALDHEVIPAILAGLNREPGPVERRIARDKDFDVWSQDARFPRADWQYEAGNGDTNLGYWEWVDHQYEAAGEPENA